MTELSSRAKRMIARRDQPWVPDDPTLATPELRSRLEALGATRINEFLDFHERFTRRRYFVEGEGGRQFGLAQPWQVVADLPDLLVQRLAPSRWFAGCLRVHSFKPEPVRRAARLDGRSPYQDRTPGSLFESSPPPRILFMADDDSLWDRGPAKNPPGACRALLAASPSGGERRRPRGMGRRTDSHPVLAPLRGRRAPADRTRSVGVGLDDRGRGRANARRDRGEEALDRTIPRAPDAARAVAVSAARPRAEPAPSRSNGRPHARLPPPRDRGRCSTPRARNSEGRRAP